jgi:hypothetical protein
VDKTYREIWEQACAEGRGGWENGRPWVDTDVSEEAGVSGCSMRNRGPDCILFDAEPGIMPCHDCMRIMGKDFFWPSSEPLPEVPHG